MVDRKELGETERSDELVPGKLEPLYRYAQTLRDRAADVIADAEALKRIDTGAWTGPAYDAYAEDNANQWPKWFKLGDAMAYGAQAIENYRHAPIQRCAPGPGLRVRPNRGAHPHTAPHPAAGPRQARAHY